MMRFALLLLLVVSAVRFGVGGCLAASPDVQNPDAIAVLTDAQRQSLASNGFVVVPDAEPQMYSLYQAATRRGVPVFVTTDAVLHAFHVLCDYTLRHVESEFLAPALDELLQSMLDGSLRLTRSPSAAVTSAAWDNVAFIAVTQQLLSPGLQVPTDVRDRVAAEVALIADHTGIAISPVFGVEEDYSQYVPRGHYTRSEALQRYFRTMMWLGRMPFLLRPAETPAAVELGRQRTRQAILLVYVLRDGSAGSEAPLRAWERIYSSTAFFAGTSDDLTAQDYESVMDSVYGATFVPEDLDDTVRLDQFIDSTLEAHPPRIVSSPVTDREDAVRATKGFRFMGQRFVFDSYVFQQLVYNQVGVHQGSGTPFSAVPSQAGVIRGIPRGLDIAAVFGAERALEILRADGDAAYEGYEEQMGRLRREVGALPPEQWSENLYWGWLGCLRPLLEEKGSAYPPFMRNDAWVDKDLQTFLGSWTELRHDTLLYSKQSTTIQATALQPARSDSAGYVEPQPEVYSRVAALGRAMQASLRAADVLHVEIASKLVELVQLADDLAAISAKELDGVPLTAEETRLIGRFGHTLESLTTFQLPADGGLTTETDARMAIVADVHTDVNSGLVLEEAVGDAFRLYVLVPSETAPVAMVGAVFSCYEFKQLMGERMTDETWQALEPRPAQPAWVQSFVVE